MGRFEFERFNGFARRELDDLLFEDFWNHDIFNERDMHGAAYHYIREYCRRTERDDVYVRCEPLLNGMRPDIVLYEKGDPIYLLEFKMFTKPDYINEDAVYIDLDKLKKVVTACDSVRWAFFHMIYDCDEPYSYSNSRLRRAGYENISVITMNARRKEETARRRVGYDEWRAQFDRLRTLHNEYA